jgi:hypothetical protein
VGRLLLAAVAAAAVALGMYNFVSFMAETQRLGGDASSGYVQDGHYFVANHGHYTEVTPDEWEGSRTHLRSVFVTHPLALAGMAYLVIGVLLPMMMGRRSPEAPERARSVISSGPVLASATCRARVGNVNIRARVAVHAAGIVITPMLAGERAVLAREIVASRERKTLLARGIEIEHAAVDIASPIALWVAADSDLATAIRRTTPWSG